MSDKKIKYQTKEVKVIRGRENHAIKKWSAEGWEFVSSSEGKIQTVIHFKKEVPPTNWKKIGIIASVLILILGGLGILSFFDNDAKNRSVSVGQSTESVTPEEPLNSDKENKDLKNNPTPTHSSPAVDEVINVENNPEFADVLKETNPGSDKIRNFVERNQGKIIEFDGAITGLAPHGSYSTRFDILLMPGDYNPDIQKGPQFKFEDVNIVSDLNISNPDTIKNLATGDNLKVKARISAMSEEGEPDIVFLEPISTTVR